MNYLSYDHNTLIWFLFTFYTLTILFLLPLPQQANLLASAEETNQQAIQLASGLILRTVLIVPMLLLLKNTI